MKNYLYHIVTVLCCALSTVHASQPPCRRQTLIPTEQEIQQFHTDMIENHTRALSSIKIYGKHITTGVPVVVTAAEYWEPVTLEALLNVPGLDLNVVDSSGMNALHALIGRTIGITPTEKATLIQLMMKRGIDSNVDINDRFLAAAERNDFSTIASLLGGTIGTTKPDVNAKDVLGRTALMFAARRLNFVLVQHLLTRNADADLQDQSGYTALMEAILAPTVKKTAKETAKARTVQTDIIEKLLFTNFSIDAQTKDGVTALMFAVSQNNAQAVATLINYDAKVNLQTKQGVSALMIAAGERNISMIRRLLAAGAKTELKDIAGQTAAAYAHGDLEILNLIAPSEKVSAALKELRKPIRGLTGALPLPR